MRTKWTWFNIGTHLEGLADMELLSKEALISAAGAVDKPVAFLVGSPLSTDSSGGVPGTDSMLDLIREEVEKTVPDGLARFETELRTKAGAEAYQTAFGWLLANVNQNAVNRVVERAVMKAFQKPDALDEMENIEFDPHGWYIPVGTKSLADLTCAVPQFGGPILTTNFDPLLSLAIRQSGRIPQRRVLDVDGALPREVEDEPETRSIVHLHGYWRDSATLHTGIQLRTSRPKLRAALQKLLRSRVLIVVAYGGWDDVFTNALSELLHDAQPELDVLWCFHESDPVIVGARYKNLLDSVAPAIGQGRFRAYGGIDCHTIFTEIAEAVRGGQATASRSDSPLTGWEQIDRSYLDALAPLGQDEILRYFDGAVPAWRHAVSDAIPRRQPVLRLLNQLEDTRTFGDCSLHLILAAGGEGKSTVLRQVAADAVRTADWSVLWRPDPRTQLDLGEVDSLDADQNWLLVADDAENLVNQLFACSQRLHERGCSNVHFLLAARDPDWRAAGGFRQPWASRLNYDEDTVLRGVTYKDAKDIVGAWNAYGTAGLKNLANITDDSDRVIAFQSAVSQEDSSRGEGSFFGGLLTVRFGEAGLLAHVREFINRLQTVQIEGSSYSLFDAIIYIAACHGVGIPGIDENVLADLLGVPRNRIHSRVVRPLGEEAAAVRSAGHILTRHSRVAAGILVEADGGLGIDVGEIWSTLVKQTILTSREMHVGHLSHPRIVHAGPSLQRDLPKQIPEKRREEIAIAAATASVDSEPQRLSYTVDLGRTYRFASRVNDAIQLFRKHVSTLESKSDYESDVRGYWYEWGVCEGLAGDHRSNFAANGWLVGLSLSDRLKPTPISGENMRLSLVGLGVPFGKLVTPNPGCHFANGLRAVAYLGRKIRRSDDLRGISYLDRHDRQADAIGTPHPKNAKQALDWVTIAVRGAWEELDDEFLREIANPSQVTFDTLSALFPTD